MQYLLELGCVHVVEKHLDSNIHYYISRCLKRPKITHLIYNIALDLINQSSNKDLHMGGSDIGIIKKEKKREKDLL